ncbi:MAG: hypothetical protein ACOYD4_02750 [Solirubrobacterales bacterium]
MKKIVPRLTYANVIASIALFVALGGASYAAFKLPRNSVGTKQLQKNAVTGIKIRNGSITGAEIRARTLGTVPRAETAALADSATQARTAGDATTLQGNGPGAFMQGGGRFVSVSEPVAVGTTGAPLVTLPGLGSFSANCLPGTTYPKGEIKFTNSSGSTLEDTLQYQSGVDGGQILNGATTGLGGDEYVGAWTWQLARAGAENGPVATMNLSFVSVSKARCTMIVQGTTTF